MRVCQKSLMFFASCVIMDGIMKAGFLPVRFLPGLFVFSLCAGFAAGASSNCKGALMPKTAADKPASLAEKPSSLAERPPEETGDMESLARDAAGGAAGGLALDAVTGEEISAAGLMTDAAMGAGAGIALRAIAPDAAKAVDDVVDDAFRETGRLLDDLFGF